MRELRQRGLVDRGGLLTGADRETWEHLAGRLRSVPWIIRDALEKYGPTARK
ncbi:hypothetical protein ACIQU6_30665 [Streptomyces sp. NPDC090442]|uniref:hypothetical protein n=1 Tax=Streptomyces sp. NPDC090442 TaxID=3365962 RepID=UPI0038299358